MTVKQSLEALLSSVGTVTDEITFHAGEIERKYEELLQQQEEMSRSIKKLHKDSMSMSYRRSFK